MNKELFKCYEVLDLPIESTIEQVKDREKALIKILKAKEKEESISCEKEMEKVVLSKNKIIENIEKNGVPKEKPHRFESSAESLIIMFIICLCAGIMCYFSFTLFS